MGKRGFTLVEVLVALVVLSVGLLALAKMSVVYLRASSQTHMASEEVLLAQGKMEELRKYAVPDQPGNFSVFNFDYLVSTNPAFTTVLDPPTSATTPPPTKTVSGLCSGGNGGAPVTTTGGTTYVVVYDNGTNGDVTAGDGIYTNSDYIDVGTQATTTAGATGYKVARVWSVQPITINTRTDYAKLTVDALWTDRQNVTRTVHLESLAHRRQ